MARPNPTAGGGPVSGRTLGARVAAALLRPPVYFGFLLFLAAAAAVHMLLLGPQAFPKTQAFPYGLPSEDSWPGPYLHVNNFVIFKRSFAHLLAGRDLYAAFPADHFDYFKYSPTFAALMAPFAYLPTPVGAVLWNVLNAGVFVAAMRRLPVLDARAKGLVCWFVVPEFLGACQNMQTNVLVAGLTILAFASCERSDDVGASLAVVLSFYVKIYGLLAALLFLLYARRRRFVLLAVAWGVLLGLVPLLFVPPAQLAFLYRSWFRLVQADRLTTVGFSVMAWLRAWFHISPPPLVVVGAGFLGLVAPLANRRAFGDFGFRLTFLCSLLLWAVVFNHKAESSTFVIAMAGAGLWYFARPRRPWRTALAWLAFALTSVAYSDLVPPDVKGRFVIPLVLKVVALLLVWLATVVEEARWPGPGADTSVSGTVPA